MGYESRRLRGLYVKIFPGDFPTDVWSPCPTCICDQHYRYQKELEIYRGADTFHLIMDLNRHMQDNDFPWMRKGLEDGFFNILNKDSFSLKDRIEDRKERRALHGKNN